MGKEQQNWEPDVKKAKEMAENIKDLNKKLKDDADKRKIDGFNPNDLLKK